MLTTSPHGRPDFLQDLLEVRNDPKVKSLALRRARDPDLADDALQATYYAVAQVADPASIRDLRAYFCRALIREIHHQRAQFGAVLVDDVADLVDARQRQSGASLVTSRPVIDTVSTHILAEDWFHPFTTQHADLLSRVPGRSHDPARYRDAIVAVAEWVLRVGMIEKIRDSDLNAVLCSAYPEWFDEPGCADNTRHQRFGRARGDARGLLQTIVSRDDLRP